MNKNAKERILNLLKENSYKWWTTGEVFNKLKLSYDTCRVLLKELHKEGKVLFDIYKEERKYPEHIYKIKGDDKNGKT